MSRLDLLSDPLMHVRTGRGRSSMASLPQILEGLAVGSSIEFPAVRAHQQHPWYVFLAQLAALALHRSRQEFQLASAEQWKAWLLNLTGGAEAAFCLVEANLSKPAFFQPPVPGRDLAPFKREALTPDELDVLVTSKNHDVKGSRMGQAAPEHWIYSLVTLQTMEGFLGAGNYGIVRMNGGFASRAFVSYAPTLEWGARFCRDVPLLLSERRKLIGSHGYPDEGGKTLLWLEPWDGNTSIDLQDCDPFFIEICRRVRLRTQGDHVSAVMCPTRCARIAPRNIRGDTGDPWLPVEKGDEPKALNVSSGGFGYDLVQRLIVSGDFRPGVAQRFHPSDPEAMIFFASALARKQGGTEGFHERTVPIPGKIRGYLTSRSSRAKLETIAKQRVEDAARWKRDVLRWALCALEQGRFRNIDLSDQRARARLRHLDMQVDRIFFTALWEDAEEPIAEANLKWNRKMMALAWAELGYAESSMGVSAVDYYRNSAFARRMFRLRARQAFPDLFEKNEEEQNER